MRTTWYTSVPTVSSTMVAAVWAPAVRTLASMADLAGSPNVATCRASSRELFPDPFSPHTAVTPVSGKNAVSPP